MREQLEGWVDVKPVLFHYRHVSRVMCPCVDRKGRTVVKTPFSAAPALLVITCFDSCSDKHPFGSVSLTRIFTVRVDCVCRTEVPLSHLPTVRPWTVLPLRKNSLSHSFFM